MEQRRTDGTPHTKARLRMQRNDMTIKRREKDGLPRARFASLSTARWAATGSLLPGWGIAGGQERASDVLYVPTRKTTSVISDMIAINVY